MTCDDRRRRASQCHAYARKSSPAVCWCPWGPGAVGQATAHGAVRIGPSFQAISYAGMKRLFLL